MIYFFSWESIVPRKLNGLLVYHPKRWQSIVKNKTIDVWGDCECCSGVISWLTFREAFCAKGLCVLRSLWTGPGWKGLTAAERVKKEPAESEVTEGEWVELGVSSPSLFFPLSSCFLFEFCSGGDYSQKNWRGLLPITPTILVNSLFQAWLVISSLIFEKKLLL